MKRPPLYTFLEYVRFRPFFKWLYRIEITGAERVPLEGGAILIANHESMIDPWLLALVTPRPVRYMAKAELWGYFGLRQVMEWFGTFPVERGTGDRQAVGRAAQLLAEGQMLGMYPQGTCLPYRHRPWHRGAAKLAIASGVPIIPVAIIGSERALRPGKPKLGRPQIDIHVGEPILVERGRTTVAAAKELTARIEQAVEELRAGYGPLQHAWFEEEQAA